MAGEPLAVDLADTIITVTTPATDLLAAWHEAGTGGFRLRPARLPADLEQITRRLVPLLRARGLFEPRGGTLRERLGLPRALNRYEEGVPVA